MPETKTISFEYMNHNGKRSMRTIDVDRVEFCMEPGFGYQPGWAVSGRCHEKNARRTFFLSRIVFPEPEKGIRHIPLLTL